VRYFLDAGTDAACVALFDPAALPDDFDRHWEESPIEFARVLQQEGRMFFVETGADGSYSLELFVDEEVPENLCTYAADPIELPRFRIPGGTLLFCGGEYAAREAQESVANRASLVAGEYHAKFWRTEYPQEMVYNMVKSKLGPIRHGVETFIGTMTGLAIVSSVLLLPALLFFWFAQWVWIGLAISLPLAGLGMFVLKLPYFERIQADRRGVEKEYPSIIGQMRRLDLPQG
jgi:hypothetical protein